MGTLGYRQDLLDKAGIAFPKTAEEFITAAEKIQKAADKQVIKVDQQGNASSWLESEEFKKDADFSVNCTRKS